MSEYPKQMIDPDGFEVTAFGPPDSNGDQAYMIDGFWQVDRLRPLPPPDDKVMVVVTMTRAQRDYIAGTVPVSVADNWSPVVDACRAHRDAEA